MNAILTRIAAIYKDSFQSNPRYYFSPGRINLIGEHIDYNDGFVLPAAIDKGIYYAVGRNETKEIHFCAADQNEWYSVAIPAIQKMNGWKNYVLSVVQEFVLLKINIGGLDCVFGGDIPSGSGMSSSAAVEGGLAYAINDLFQCGLSPKEMALLCQRAEHHFPNVKCGIMDQYANMLGKKNQVILLDCKNITHEYFPLQLGDYSIVMINSKVHHLLASGEYNVRRQQCEEGLAIIKNELNLHSFRDISSMDILESCKHLMSTLVFNRCQFVVEEIARTKKAAALLQNNELNGLGALLYQSHEGLSHLYEVSCPELDYLVSLAQVQPAVLGARMMGGGFGGCTINIVKTAAANSFIESITTAYQNKFNIVAEAYIVTPGDGTKRVE